jgi:hypothetical protein
MKLSTFTQAALLMLLIAFAASCGSSRSTPQYPDHREYPGDPDRYPRDGRSSHKIPPGQRKKYGSYPLIIRRSPGMGIWRTHDGRYYYKNADGFYYWQGYDDRLYLDERYLSQVEYDHYAYKEWKDHGRSNAGRYKKSRY